MALTYTPAGELGSRMPRFKAKSVDGREYTDEAVLRNAKALVVLFICNHCPYVQAVEDRLIRLAKDFAARGASFLGVCSNDPADNPEDEPTELLKRWQTKGYGFPYLVDEDQTLARAFGAVCTPDIFVFDHDGRLVYRGRIDDSWRDERKVQRQELREALEAVIQGRSVSDAQNPSMGCSIKWKKS